MNIFQVKAGFDCFSENAQSYLLQVNEQTESITIFDIEQNSIHEIRFKVSSEIDDISFIQDLIENYSRHIYVVTIKKINHGQ